MSLLIIQLSDLHATIDGNTVESKWDLLCRSVTAEIVESTSACVIVFNGDASYGGIAEEFEVARILLDRLVQAIKNTKGLDANVICVPGNHDCDLTSEDEAARYALKGAVQGAKRPAPSVEKALLEKQKAYFNFVTSAEIITASPHSESPYCEHCDVTVGEEIVRFHLFNSSWTSVKKEKKDLLFPVEVFNPPNFPEASLAITVIHHPLHWFSLGDVYKQLRKAIEESSDYILTGHEHDDEASTRRLSTGLEINYLEGGVLQEHGLSSLCTFNMLSIDFDEMTRTTKRFEWQQDHFEPKRDADGEIALTVNSLRRDRRFRLRAKFEESLDELQDPITHPRVRDLRLSQLFTCPDLRKITDFSSDDSSESNSVVDHIKGDKAFEEIFNHEKVLITGGEKFGKSSLAKQLFSKIRRSGKVPVLLSGRELGNDGHEKNLRTRIGRVIGKEYIDVSLSSYEQLDPQMQVVIVDNFEDGPQNAAARSRTIKFLNNRFETVILIASDEILIEMLGQGNGESSELLEYQRYEICEFLSLRFQELATRWVTLGHTEIDGQNVRALVSDLCKNVEQLLAVAGMPHTPFLLTALMAELSEAGIDSLDIALKNGNYGPLYAAAITRSLARSKWPTFDLTGKITYLGELAHELYRLDKATIAESDAKRFHAEFCKRFTDRDFDRVINDLVDCEILRNDDGVISFRHKYTFCYFAAKWLSRNIRNANRQDEVLGTVETLGKHLHHDVSANILVFLAHDSSDPEVLSAIRRAASEQFTGEPLAELDGDVKSINSLTIVKSIFVLPATAPDVNRRLIQEAEDERRAIAKQRQHDGRSLSVKSKDEDIQESADDPNAMEQRKILKDIRASVRTLRILGQVSRNGATSMEREELIGMLGEVIDLGRRLLGFVFKHSENLDELVHHFKHRCFAYMIKEKRSEFEDDRVPLKIQKTLAKEADAIAREYLFGMYWGATQALLKRMSFSIGMKTLDPIFDEINTKEATRLHQLLGLQIRFGRRGLTIPADDMVRLHAELTKDKNTLARVVLETMTYERLLMLETREDLKQRVCQQMDIKIPKKTFDPGRKKFTLK